MTEDVEALLERLRARLTEDQLREWLRASHEVLDRAAAEDATNAHLDQVAAEHSGGPRGGWPARRLGGL